MAADGTELQEIPSNMSELPSDIIMHILYRLPFKILCRCRSVCKTWRNLLLEPYFMDLQQNQARTAIMLPLYSPSIENHRNLCMIDVEDRCVVGDIMVNLDAEGDNIPKPILVMGNSCNGLVCICEEGSFDPVYIWNPILGQCMTLPNGFREPGVYSISGFGFGFSPSTGKYKVLRMFSTGEVEICTLGMDTSWRSIKCGPYRPHCKSRCTFLNGALHWIVSGTQKSEELICSFDIEHEEFGVVPPPVIFSPNNGTKIDWSNLGVLQGCLYICARDANAFRPDVEIWVMKEYGVKDSWVKELAIKDPPVQWWKRYRRLQLIKFMKSGDILMLCGYVLFIYNPRDRTFITLKESYFEVIAHVPSFVSRQDVEME